MFYIILCCDFNAIYWIFQEERCHVVMRDDLLLTDTYAKMPPIESFMGVDWTAARRHFFNVSIKIKARLTHYISRSQRYWLLTTLYLLLYILESEL